MQFQELAEAIFIPCVLVSSMLGMGMTLSPRDFLTVFKRPTSVLLGLFLQIVLVPLVALGVTTVADVSQGWAVGLLLVSVVPGGAFSNLMTYFGRGNVPLSISLTVTATLTCIFTVPLVLGLTAGAYLPADFEFPTGQIVLNIFFFLLIPLSAGMVFFRLDPDRSRAWAPWLIRLAVLFLVLITVSSLGSGRIQITAYGWGPPLMVMGFGVLVALLIPLICRLARRPDADTVAIGIEVTLRNIGVALLLFGSFFTGDDPSSVEAQGQVLYVCLFYSGFSAFTSVPMLLLHRFGRSPIPFLAPFPARQEEVDKERTSRQLGEHM